ncbi:MAG: amino acid ABC transporter permease [Paracoccus sp. (in: a-proteobacteria)]|nr:amino acid ABC transporter permease [Paracoccus sp. (in: a-proteobacteria)]
MSEIHAQTVPYVRDTMLPEQAPPARQSGVVLWLRENLFSGPVNIALTLIGVWMIWYLVSGIWPWLAHSVWRADNLSECRSIITASFGEGATGACWAMIRERWNQFLFGFYPQDLYWRPVLAFVLLFVALAPVLFSQIPRKALYFSAFYPALAYWLLWGGSAWWPLMVLAGFAAGLAVWAVVSRWSVPLGLLAGLAATLVWWFWIAAPLAAELEKLISLHILQVRSDRFGGFVLSITIGVAGIAMSLPLGIVLALARRSDMPIIKMFAVVFIEFIRGVPLITLLFVASLLLNYFLPPGTNFDIILRVIIMVTLFAAAYMAEVIRGGLAALPKGQYEAADALGLDYWKAQRLIILPQALKISIPGIVSTFIGMFKDTTLVVFVGLLDPLKGVTDAVRASTDWKGIYWEPYIFVAAIFFIFCYAMSRYSMYLERRLKRDHR